MLKDNFHEKITLILSTLILTNYLLIGLEISQFLIKINFLLFLFFTSVYYFKNFSENIYLKVFFLFIILISLGIPTFGWDARSIWLFHAKRIFFDQSIFSVSDHYADFSHNAYPSLAPAFSSALATVLGYWNEVIPKISFTLIFFPPLIFMYIFFKESKYIFFLFLVFFIIGKYLFNGWVDGLIAIYFSLCAFLMYFLFISENLKFKNKSIYYFIAFCFFTTLTLIKNEGIVMLLILFFVTFCFKLHKGDIKKEIHKLFYLSFSFIPIILWKYFCFIKGTGTYYGDADIIANFISRIGYIENYKLIAYFLFLNEKFLICMTFFLIALWINRNLELFSYVFLILFLYILVLFITFLSTPVDFYFQLDSAASRIVRSLNFLLAFFGLCSFNYKKIKN